jgi:molecular chaperone GrpE
VSSVPETYLKHNKKQENAGADMTRRKPVSSMQENDAQSVEDEAIETVGESEQIAEVQETPEQAALEEIKMLQNELAETQAKANEYLDGWQRSRAEFVNYKKRIEREQAETYQRAAGNVIKRYLEILDDMDLALKNRPGQGDGAVWAEGIDLIYRKLLTILDGEGVKPMALLGEPFDPNQHEAISMEPSETVPSGHVCEVLKQGYLLGDKVLRPALVRVAL